MKKIKLILIIALSLLCLTACGDSDVTNKNYSYVSISEEKLPNFTFFIGGKYTGLLDNSNISDITLYDFSLNYNLGEKNREDGVIYTGVEVLEVLEYFNAVEYEKATFVTFNNEYIEYTKEELDSNVHLVFLKDKKAVDDTLSVQLVNANTYSEYWYKPIQGILLED